MRGIAGLCFAVGLSGAFTASAAERETAGIGAALKLDGDDVIVQKILRGSPAAGLKNIAVGDRILAIGQKNEPPVAVKGLPLNKVVELVRGPQGSTVRLTIVPVGKDESQARVISLTRGEFEGISPLGRRPAPGRRNSGARHCPDPTERQAAGAAGRPSRENHSARVLGHLVRTVRETNRSPARGCPTAPGMEGQVVLIAASVDDDADTAARHATAAKWDQTHNVWIALEVLKAYHVDGLPSIYIIDRKGNVAAYDGTESIVDTVNRLIKAEDRRLKTED